MEGETKEMVKVKLYDAIQSDRGWKLFIAFVKMWKHSTALLNNRLKVGCNFVDLNTVDILACSWVLNTVDLSKTDLKVWDVKQFSDGFMVSFLEYRGLKYAISVDFVTNRVRVMLIKNASDVYKACECDSRRTKLCK